MIDFSQTCIFCGSKDNLDTVMTMKVDNKEYKIAISKECEDKAVPSKLKELIIKKSSENEAKFELLKQAAAELGFNLTPTLLQNNKLAIVEKNDKPKNIQPVSFSKTENGFAVQKDNRDKQKKSENELTPQEAELALEAAKRKSQQGEEELQRPTSKEAPNFESLKIPDKVEVKDANGTRIVERPQNVAQKRQVVRGRAGVPVSVPKTITATSGKSTIETTINIVDTGGDKTIQDRLKMLNYLEENPNYLRSCNYCRSTGMVGKHNDICKKCSGTGFIF